ncbi:MAG: ABC transporter permease [Bacteroidales bacterium]
MLSIFGLASAMFVGFFLLSDVNRMLDFDKCHEKHDRIYRVISDHIIYDNFRQPLVPYILATKMKQDFPEVEAVARYSIIPGVIGRVFVNKDDEFVDERQFYCADREIFDILTIPLISKESESFLSEPSLVVLSKDMAVKYFNEPNPVGKMLEIRTMGKIQQLRVSAIMENFPENSTFQADFIVNTDFYLNMFRKDYSNLEQTIQSWSFDQINLILLLKEDASEVGTNSKLDHLISSIEGLEDYKYYLQKLTDVYLFSQDIHNDFIEKGEISDLYVFTAIALLILLVASINYIIITTARLSLRHKEIGIKKVFGISTQSIMVQIIIESTLVALFSLLFAVILVFIFKDHSDLFLMNKVIYLGNNTLKVFILFIGLALIIGILSGLYISFQVTL